MRIGIVPTNWRAGGGTYQYCLTMLDALRQMESSDEFVVFHYPITELPLSQLKAWSFETVALDLLEQNSFLRAEMSWVLNGLGRVVGEGPVRQAWRRVRQRFFRQGVSRKWNGEIDTVHRNAPWQSWFHRHRIELMIYPAPTEWAFEIGIPYVMAIHDLMYRFHPEFPEAFVHGGPEFYEYLHRNGTRYATTVLVDSEVGKEDVLNFYEGYGITPDRVKVLPFLPAPYLPSAVPREESQRVVRRYHLPKHYLLYPARFWLHKNHARLFEAMLLLKKRHQMEVHLVLVGFDKSEKPPKGEILFHDMRSMCHQLGLQEQVQFLGVIPDEDMAGLYAAATALVMPTLCGPTNIPVLEAWQMGCPVMTSDIRGIREHAGDAAILVSPYSVGAIADGIRRLWTDETLRRAQADRGRHRLASYTPDDYRQRLKEILEEASARVRLDKSKSAKQKSLPGRGIR